MAEVDNLLDFGPTSSDTQNQMQTENGHHENLLDLDNYEADAIEKKEPQSSQLAEEQPPAARADEVAEEVAAAGEDKEVTVVAEGEQEKVDAVAEHQQQQQQQEEGAEVDPQEALTDNPAEVEESTQEQQQEHQQEPQPLIDMDQQAAAAAPSSAVDFLDIQSADGHPVADSAADSDRLVASPAADAAVDDEAVKLSQLEVQVDDSQQQQLLQAAAADDSTSGAVQAVPVWPQPDDAPSNRSSQPSGASPTATQQQQQKMSSSSSSDARSHPYFVGVGIGSSGDVCRLCQKKVYPMELLTSDGQVYHKSCYRCHKCKRLLSVGNFGVLDNQLYCQPHYLEIFRIRGHYQAPADRPPAEVIGSDNAPVDDGISHVQKLSQLKSKFEATDESPVVVTPPAGASRAPVSPGKSAAAAGPTADVVRSGDAKEDELPQPGTSKNMLALFRSLEQGGGAAQQQQREDPSAARQKVSISSAGVRVNQSGDNSPVEDAAEPSRHADVVRSGEPNPAEELPPANFTRSALQLWKDKEVQGGGAGRAPNPENSERLRSRARETSGVNNNIRLPGAAAAAVSATAATAAAGDSAAAAAAASQPRDESAENQPSPPTREVARWDEGGTAEEMPAQGTAKNLRSLFSGGQ